MLTITKYAQGTTKVQHLLRSWKKKNPEGETVKTFVTFAQRMASSSTEEGEKKTTKDKCVFCRIALKQEPEGSKVSYAYEDDAYTVFPDHRPAGKSHFLIMPKKHVRSINDLRRADVPMVRRMEEIAKQVLVEKGADMGDVLLGFHWPLFAIGHLHLHAISPTNEMSWLQKVEFASTFFGSVDAAVKVLEKRE